MDSWSEKGFLSVRRRRGNAFGDLVPVAAVCGHPGDSIWVEPGLLWMNMNRTETSLHQGTRSRTWRGAGLGGRQG